MKCKKYEAIIFDLDGTLIDSMPYHLKAFQELLSERKIKVSEKFLKGLMGMSTAKILEYFKKKYKIKDNVIDLREERRYHYFRILGERNIVFSGVSETLKSLKSNNKLAIATGSSYVTVSHSMKKSFLDLFDELVTINDVKKGKPHPEQLLVAAKKMKVKNSECLMVGDSIYDGIAARRSGMDFIGVTTGFTSEKELKKFGAIVTIKKISELKRTLQNSQSSLRRSLNDH